MGYTGKTNRIAPPAESAILRYGLAFASVAAALGLARTFLHFHLPVAFTAFALSAIAITFWYGGTKPALSQLCFRRLSAVISSILKSIPWLAFFKTLCSWSLRC
jgi:hypothetical protein